MCCVGERLDGIAIAGHGGLRRRGVSGQSARTGLTSPAA